MMVKLLLDINLSLDWLPLLRQHGWEAVHWSEVGDPRAADRTIMDWALQNGYAVFTHDLDFGTLLALTHDTGPSVIQARGQDVLPDRIGGAIVAAIRDHEQELAAGALIVVEERKRRVRVLPL